MVFLGSREELAHLGYVAGQCPKCRKQGMFSVFTAKRKLTLYAIPALPMGEQLLLECRFCNARFALPPDQREELQRRLISADKLADLAGQLPIGAGGNGQANGAAPVRSLYQILQVDPYADPEVVEAAFKRLAFKYHPDRSTAADAPARMRELIEAREVLHDPRKRRAYDRTIGIEHVERRPVALRPEEV